MDLSLRNHIKKLSISERILLAEEIWDTVAEENQSFELTQSQKLELEQRSEEFKANPELGRSWDEIKAEFLGK
jgi:putative addiction module component (TIGR02574 family)